MLTKTNLSQPQMPQKRFHRYLSMLHAGKAAFEKPSQISLRKVNVIERTYIHNRDRVHSAVSISKKTTYRPIKQVPH